MGDADGSIMPAIITVHIANVKKPSAAVHGIPAVIPIAAIDFSYSMPIDI